MFLIHCALSSCTHNTTSSLWLPKDQGNFVGGHFFFLPSNFCCLIMDLVDSLKYFSKRHWLPDSSSIQGRRKDYLRRQEILEYDRFCFYFCQNLGMGPLNPGSDGSAFNQSEPSSFNQLFFFALLWFHFRLPGAEEEILNWAKKGQCGFSKNSQNYSKDQFYAAIFKFAIPNYGSSRALGS